MRKIRIYCEDGAYQKEIRGLKRDYNVELFTFPFENKNKRAKIPKSPSELTCDSTYITIDNDFIRISDTEKSALFSSIVEIIGKDNYNDARHIDTAYKNNCKIFVSPDKGDIINNSEALMRLTGIRFFHWKEYEDLKEHLNFLDEDIL